MGELTVTAACHDDAITMDKPTPFDDRVLALYNSGASARAVAETMRISVNIIYGVIERARKRGVAMRTRPATARNIPASGIPGARSCQYIAGEPSADDACKCGAPVAPGSSYCQEHRALCSAPAQPPSEAGTVPTKIIFLR
jgi:hypothetical protein